MNSNEDQITELEPHPDCNKESPIDENGGIFSDEPDIKDSSFMDQEAIQLLKLSNEFCKFTTRLSQQITNLRQENRRLNRELREFKKKQLMAQGKRLGGSDSNLLSKLGKPDVLDSNDQDLLGISADFDAVFDLGDQSDLSQAEDLRQTLYQKREEFIMAREKKLSGIAKSLGSGEGNSEEKSATGCKTFEGDSDDDAPCVMPTREALERLRFQVDRLNGAVQAAAKGREDYYHKGLMLEKELAELKYRELSPTVPIVSSTVEIGAAKGHSERCDDEEPSFATKGEQDWKAIAQELEQKLVESEMQKQQLMVQLSSKASAIPVLGGIKVVDTSLTATSGRRSSYGSRRGSLGSLGTETVESVKRASAA